MDDIENAEMVVVVLRGSGDVLADLADARERYGWDLAMKPMVPDAAGMAVLQVLGGAPVAQLVDDNDRPEGYT